MSGGASFGDASYRVVYVVGVVLWEGGVRAEGGKGGGGEGLGIVKAGWLEIAYRFTIYSGHENSPIKGGEGDLTDGPRKT